MLANKCFCCFTEKVTSNLNLNKVMNIVCYMQEKWCMVGMRLKIPPSILDDICKKCDGNQIPDDSADTFCCIKMFKYWLSFGDNISVDTLLHVLGTVNLKSRMSSIEIALESQLVMDNSDPPEKQQRLLTKLCVQLDNLEVDINNVLVYLKLSNLDLNVLNNVAKISDLIHSLEKYNYLNKTDLSWLKYVVDHVKNLEAQKIINDYETSLLADKIFWYSSHPSGTFLAGKISVQPETVTIHNIYLAKSAASDVVGIKITDSILEFAGVESAGVGSVIFYGKITSDKGFKIPKNVSNSMKRKCENAGLTHIGKMVDGSTEFVRIGELEECPEGNYVTVHGCIKG